MKAGNFIFATGVLLVTIAAAYAQTPVEDKDAFEKQYIECIMSGLKNKCFSALFSGHFSPEAEDRAPYISQATKSLYMFDGFANQLGSVYQVHLLDKIMRANVLDSRTYLIEHSNNRFSGAYISFIRVKGEWYVISFNISDSDEFVKKLLKLPPVD